MLRSSAMGFPCKVAHIFNILTFLLTFPNEMKSASLLSLVQRCWCSVVKAGWAGWHDVLAHAPPLTVIIWLPSAQAGVWTHWRSLLPASTTFSVRGAGWVLCTDNSEPRVNCVPKPPPTLTTSHNQWLHNELMNSVVVAAGHGKDNCLYHYILGCGKIVRKSSCRKTVVQKCKMWVWKPHYWKIKEQNRHFVKFQMKNVNFYGAYW